VFRAPNGETIINSSGESRVDVSVSFVSKSNIMLYTLRVLINVHYV